MSYASRNQILASLGFPTYTDYLQSELWAEIRLRILNSANRRCCGCKQMAIQVHHGEYTRGNLTGESHEYLYPICHKCHQAIEFCRGRKIMDLTIVGDRLRLLMAGGTLGDGKPPRIARKAPKPTLTPKKKPGARKVRLRPSKGQTENGLTKSVEVAAKNYHLALSGQAKHLKRKKKVLARAIATLAEYKRRA